MTCPHGSLSAQGCSACEIDRLCDAIDRLWCWMGVAEANAIRDGDVELAELAMHAHHRMSHEQRMMRRDPAAPDPEGSKRAGLIRAIVGIIGHYSCVEDCWYSCPMSSEGTCNDEKGTDCDCGVEAKAARIVDVLSGATA